MIIFCTNLIAVIVFAMINVRYIISFEVAFIGALFVFYSSYRAVMRKISNKSSLRDSPHCCHIERSEISKTRKFNQNIKSMSAKNKTDSPLQKNNLNNLTPCDLDSSQTKFAKNDDVATDLPENLSKKERFFLGFRISFGLLRLLSYAFLGLGIVALINNGAFFLLPFLAGIALSTLASAIYIIKRKV